MPGCIESSKNFFSKYAKCNVFSFWNSSSPSRNGLRAQGGFQALGATVSNIINADDFRLSPTFAITQLALGITALGTICHKNINWREFFLHVGVGGLATAEFGMMMHAMANGEVCLGSLTDFHPDDSPICFNILAVEMAKIALLIVAWGVSENSKKAYIDEPQNNHQLQDNQPALGN